MPRLTLRPDDLRVQTFATHPSEGGAGTVFGHAAGQSDKATCDTCVGPNCKPSGGTCASGGDVCCA